MNNNISDNMSDNIKILGYKKNDIIIAIKTRENIKARAKRYREKNREKLSNVSQKIFIKKNVPDASDDKIQELIKIKKEYFKNKKELKTNINKIDEVIISLEKLQKSYEEIYKKTKYDKIMIKLKAIKKKRDKEKKSQKDIC
jgi:hypothetical protein